MYSLLTKYEEISIRGHLTDQAIKLHLHCYIMYIYSSIVPPLWLLLLFFTLFCLFFYYSNFYFFHSAAAAQIATASVLCWHCEIQHNKTYSSVEDTLQHQPFSAYRCVIWAILSSFAHWCYFSQCLWNQEWHAVCLEFVQVPVEIVEWKENKKYTDPIYPTKCIGPWQEMKWTCLLLNHFSGEAA